MSGSFSGAISGVTAFRDFLSSLKGVPLLEVKSLLHSKGYLKEALKNLAFVLRWVLAY